MSSDILFWILVVTVALAGVALLLQLMLLLQLIMLFQIRRNIERTNEVMLDPLRPRQILDPALKRLLSTDLVSMAYARRVERRGSLWNSGVPTSSISSTLAIHTRTEPDQAETRIERGNQESPVNYW